MNIQNESLLQNKCDFSELKVKYAELLQKIDSSKSRSNRKSVKKHQSKPARISLKHSSDIKTQTAIKCEVCDKTFSKNFSLTRHMLLHTGEKKFSCKLCSYKFIQKSDLDRHKATHSNAMLFQCKQCDRKFKTKKNLSCHLPTHTTDRPFECKICLKTFRTERTLKFHGGLHKDQKPYNCDLCGAGFSAKPYIKAHLKTNCLKDVGIKKGMKKMKSIHRKSV